MVVMLVIIVVVFLVYSIHNENGSTCSGAFSSYVFFAGVELELIVVAVVQEVFFVW